MIDVIIIGAGTAGLSAAIYVQRAGKKALVLEESTYGGQIINTADIENYPGIKHISGLKLCLNSNRLNLFLIRDDKFLSSLFLYS